MKFRGFILLLIIAAVSATLYIAASDSAGRTNDINKGDTEGSTLQTTPGSQSTEPSNRSETDGTALEMTLSPGDDIQKAVDALQDGGKLIFSEGTYDTLEAIILDGRKNLTIEGTGEVWINTKGIDHHVMTLKSCQNVTLTNIKAQHVILEEGDNAPIDDARDGAVIGVLDSTNISLNNCELVGCGIYGVYAYSTTPLLLEGCYLHDNAKSAVLLTTGAKPMHCIIRDCIITKNTGAIEVKGDVTVVHEGKNQIEYNSSNDYHRQ